ncbi:SAM--benzoic acid carboxyl methyltransferase [Enterococcus casseliflavus]|uniref:SAM--benzoic acid carboxyl methyltransferase n=1 Tax=Enterococcus casseliflavus TaxID=37734 RepID=UPI003EE0DBBD
MPPEDYQTSLCFKCDGELSSLGDLLICDECGKTYTQDEYQKLVDAEAESYISFMKKRGVI